jgi:hypothetical protein
MHASLNEDLIQPKKLEMGISHRTGGRTEIPERNGTNSADLMS